MRVVVLSDPTDFDGWRDAARSLAAAGVPASDVTWQVGEAGYESRAENCCFAGRTLQGRVLATVAAGAVVYRDRAFALSAA